MAFDIITFGSATLDLFLSPKEVLVRKEKKFRTEKAICLPFASKIEIENVLFKTGGGGTNTAATFSLHGLRTAYCGSIGKDFAGDKIISDLNERGISQDFLEKKPKRKTNLSVIFSEGGDRTVLVWREASEYLSEKDIRWNELDSSWFYLAPLSGKLSRLFAPLVHFAKQKGIKIFANPGDSQLNMEKEKLFPILAEIDVLLLNQREASLLTNVEYSKERKIFERLDKIVPGIAIMSKGKRGAVVSNGKNLWEAEALQSNVAGKTGAGDAFGAGFLTGLIRSKDDIEFALKFGVANASHCLTETGAKEGLVKNPNWQNVIVKKTKL